MMYNETMNKYKCLLTTIIIAFAFVMSGCAKTNKEVVEINKTITEENGNTANADIGSAESSADNTEFTNMKDVEVHFVNECGVDFGLVSIFDPIAEEQINIDSLMKDEEITMNMLWQKEVTEFKWAVYDLEGNLIAECKTDITEADDYFKISLLGNDRFEDVDVEFER